jgi:hypothetical protein
VSAHPHAGVADLAKQRVEPGAVAPLLDRVHPHEDAIQAQELVANLLDPLVRVDDRNSAYAQPGERREHAAESATLGDRRDTIDRIPLHPPQNPNPHVV